jgi:crossover junction endodeoxyribonuclease RuvC
MRVLGIDPGLTRCGWGVVEGRPGARPTALGVGVIRTMAELDLELRLLELHTAVTALLREHRPDVVAIERVFTQNKKGTAMGTAQAAGVAALAAAQADRPVAWHTPSEVKAAISGNGRADKEQVTLMVTRVLGLATAPKPADAADALALAICHLSAGRFRAAAGRKLSEGSGGGSGFASAAPATGLARAIAAATARETGAAKPPRNGVLG